MYVLSKEMTDMLVDYGFEYGEEEPIDWIIGESECNTMFSNPEMFCKSKKADYDYIMNADKNSYVLLYGEKE